MEELGENGLRIYTFPTEDATVAEINNKMNVSIYIYIYWKLWWLVKKGYWQKTLAFPSTEYKTMTIILYDLA